MCKWHVQRKGKLLTVLVRIKTGRATLEKSMKVLQKYKNRVTLWPFIALWGFYPRYTKTTDSKGDMHPNVYSSAMNKSQIMERAQISIDWWMDKEYVVYVLSHQKVEILPFATAWVEPECIILSKISQCKERQIPYDLTHMSNLRSKTDEHRGGREEKETNYERLVKTNWRLMEGGGWEMGYMGDRF